jgi:hypothetical protein
MLVIEQNGKSRMDPHGHSGSINQSVAEAAARDSRITPSSFIIPWRVPVQ